MRAQGNTDKLGSGSAFLEGPEVGLQGTAHIKILKQRDAPNHGHKQATDFKPVRAEGLVRRQVGCEELHAHSSGCRRHRDRFDYAVPNLSLLLPKQPLSTGQDLGNLDQLRLCPVRSKAQLPRCCHCPDHRWQALTGCSGQHQAVAELPARRDACLAALLTVKDMGQGYGAHLAHHLRLGRSGAFDEKGEVALMAEHAVATVCMRCNAALLMQGQPEHAASQGVGKFRQGQVVTGRKGEAVFAKEEVWSAALHSFFFAAEGKKNKCLIRPHNHDSLSQNIANRHPLVNAAFLEIDTQ